MTIGELKELIQDLPDEWEIYDNPAKFWIKPKLVINEKEKCLVVSYEN